MDIKSDLTVDMPKSKSKSQRLAREKARREMAELEASELRAQISQLPQKPSTTAPPLPRSCTRQRDWNCQCGRYVFGDKSVCKCGCTRTYGATVLGSLKGVVTTGPAAQSAIAKQQRVPGLSAPTARTGGKSAHTNVSARAAPTNYAEAVRGKNHIEKLEASK